ncbi:GNAT family N-acetyltransferase [Gymnodinialimonas hymeniacidonis]|uniref:GNAT family N-acetyltransferase n=1 Tax=Gymnodinialimonas hymeniacidonis TaxID=3126508 RepID=UPI0034C641E2
MWSFDTDRLSVRPLSDASRARGLAAEFVSLLTPAVLAPLPASLQLGEGPDAVANWIAERLAESDVSLVRMRGDETLVGALICVQPEPGGPVHLGYLFGEAAWGRGYATEMLSGLVTIAGPQPLRAGVARDNPASARVLEKVGFHVDHEASTERVLNYRHPE